jgi:SAM-dependent methyltransferase
VLPERSGVVTRIAMDVHGSKQDLAEWPDVVESFPDVDATYQAMGVNFDGLRQGTTAYYAWIADTLRPWLGRRTMEVGAGPGLLSAHLMEALDFYLISEKWPPYLDELRSLAGGRAQVTVRPLDATELAEQADSIRSLRLDSIFSTNMLEHIKDDVAVMRDMAAAVGPGGRVINLVPAYRKLYGENDRAIGHYRRYERAEMRAKMQAAGLEIEKVITFNQAGVFAWLTVNTLLRRTHASEEQYGAFDRFVPLFRLWEKLVPIPLGLSLIGVGRVPRDAR